MGCSSHTQGESTLRPKVSRGFEAQEGECNVRSRQKVCFLDEEHNNTREVPYIERARGGYCELNRDTCAVEVLRVSIEGPWLQYRLLK